MDSTEPTIYRQFSLEMALPIAKMKIYRARWFLQDTGSINQPQQPSILAGGALVATLTEANLPLSVLAMTIARTTTWGLAGTEASDTM